MNFNKIRLLWVLVVVSTSLFGQTAVENSPIKSMACHIKTADQESDIELTYEPMTLPQVLNNALSEKQKEEFKQNMSKIAQGRTAYRYMLLNQDMLLNQELLQAEINIFLILGNESNPITEMYAEYFDSKCEQVFDYNEDRYFQIFLEGASIECPNPKFQTKD